MDSRTITDVLKVVRGARNGFYYGAKVRFMHSVVISILFMKGSLRDKIKRIVKLTLEHGLRIGVFVLVYKTVLTVLKRVRGKQVPFHSFISGAIGAVALNYGGETAINQQITFYILSRVVIAGIKIMQEKGFLSGLNPNRWLSVVGWGFVMLLFFKDKKSLQPSLQQSMDFLYDESDTVKCWTELLPFPVPIMIQAGLEDYFPGLRNIKTSTQVEFKKEQSNHPDFPGEGRVIGESAVRGQESR